jgi:hypothetical protein
MWCGGVDEVLCGVRDRIKEELSLSFMDVVKGYYRINSTYTCDRLRSDGDMLTTCHVCSVPHN